MQRQVNQVIKPKFSRVIEPTWGRARNTRILGAGKATSGGRIWSQVDWVSMGELYQDIPNESTDFDYWALARPKDYYLHDGSMGNWRQWMHDHDVTCRLSLENQMMSERIALRSYPYDDSAGRWRLTDHVVEYSKPWAALSSAAIFEEYKRSEYPWKDYVRHLIQSFEGEVALTWEHWTWELKPLPRDAQFWCRQFATNEASSKALGNLTFERDGFGNFMVHHSIDLERVGNTTILRTEQGEKAIAILVAV